MKVSTVVNYIDMATIRFSRLRSFCSYGKLPNPINIKPSYALINRNYHSLDSGVNSNSISNGFGIMGFGSSLDKSYNRGMKTSDFKFRLSNLGLSGAPFGATGLLSSRSYSSSNTGSGDNGGFGGSDLPNKVKEILNSALDSVTNAAEKSKEVSVEMTSQVQQLLDTNPYLNDVVVPVGGTMVATFLAWIVMPRLLRRFHRFSTQGSAALLSENSLWGPVPYENSFWGALEDPVRYLVTFMAFSQIGVMIAPTTVAAQYVGPACKGAVILSFVWFLHRWKTNVITRALANKTGIDRDKLSTLDRASSIGLLVLGLLTLAEVSGVAVQSLLTVGGVGGVATAFAARDILGNVLSGLSVQMSRPFSIGDTIKAGSVEGQVMEMGFTTTSILTAEKFPAIVPNSLLSSQVIVNKTRALWRSFDTKMPLQIGDFDVIPNITDDIKTMLRSNSNVFLEREAPYCYLSGVERSYAELNIGCNLKYAGKEQLFSAQQDILLQSVQIIKKHGAALASYYQS